MLTGRTDSGKVVVFKGNEECIKKIVNVTIESDHMWYLQGKIE